MGGSEVPKEQLIWQDPIDKTKYKLKSKDIKDLKNKISKSKISISDLVSTAWASASTFRGSDKRGGANGARILLEPQADGFRNYLNGGVSNVSAEEKLVDKAQLMGLTAPEMTALVGGMMVLNTNYDGSNYGVFTNKPGSLTNDYFINLLGMDITWKEEDKSEQTFVGKDRKTQKTKWKATRVDLIFGSNSQLRALAEVYACEDSGDKFVKDFIAAWVKVMNSDRFDLKL